MSDMQEHCSGCGKPFYRCQCDRDKKGRVNDSRPATCSALGNIRQALCDFDNAREANQWPHTGQPRHKDADEFIDKVREILSQNASILPPAKSNQKDQ